jgi:hypothetical protein
MQINVINTLRSIDSCYDSLPVFTVCPAPGGAMLGCELYLSRGSS